MDEDDATGPAATDPESPVSVVLLCFNHARYVRRAIESIAQQDVRPHSVTIVDDASTDGSQEAIRSAVAGLVGNVTLVFNGENIGLVQNLNRELSRVQTEFVSFMATDDWMEPERLRRQLEEFDRQGDACALVISDMYLAGEDGHRLDERFSQRRGRVEGDPFIAGLRRCVMNAPSAMIRTASLRDVGGFDESVRMEDYDIWLRLTRHYGISYLDEPLTNYRIVATSLSNTTAAWDFRADHIPSLFKHLDIGGVRGVAVADRLLFLIRELYFRGRSVDDTRRDLTSLNRVRKTRESRALLVLVRLRMPGGAVAVVRRRLARSRTALRLGATASRARKDQ